MKRTIVVALLFYTLGVLTIIGCATAFPYRYYAAEMPDTCYDQGKLLGKSGKAGWPDLSLKECKPDPTPTTSPIPGDPKPVRLRCMTLMIDDWYSLKADDEKCHSDLDACLKGPKPQK